MPEIKEKVKSNLRDRVSAINAIGDNVSNIASTFIDHVKKMEPVQAVTRSGKLAGDGILDFVGRQAEITRRWIS